MDRLGGPGRSGHCPGTGAEEAAQESQLAPVTSSSLSVPGLTPPMPGDTPRSCQVQPFAPNVGGGVPSGPWAPNQLDSVGPDLSQASLPPPPASPTHQCHVVTVTRGVQLTRHPSKGWQGAVAQAPSQRGRMPQEGRGWPFHGRGRIRSWCCCVSGPRCDPVTGSLGSSGGRRRASRICSLCRWKGSLE